jgi:hypothetical protein
VVGLKVGSCWNFVRGALPEPKLATEQRVFVLPPAHRAKVYRGAFRHRFLLVIRNKDFDLPDLDLNDCSCPRPASSVAWAILFSSLRAASVRIATSVASQHITPTAKSMTRRRRSIRSRAPHDHSAG